MASRCLVRWWPGALAVGVILGLFASAGADVPKLELGVYVPRLALSDNAARTAHARKVAAALSKASGLPIAGRAFSRAADLRSFVRAGRLDLVLLDPVLVADEPTFYRVLAEGIGEAGAAGRELAVLARKATRGLGGLEGRRIAIVDTGTAEVRLISNYALEGEADIRTFFSKVVRAADVVQAASWIRARRADCMVAPASLASGQGLHVVSRLRALPLPLLAEVAGERALGAEPRAALEAALQREVQLGTAGPLVALRASSGGHAALSSLREALSLPPGQRPVRSAVWSPSKVEQSPRWRAEARGVHQLPRAHKRWRIPEFEEIR